MIHPWNQILFRQIAGERQRLPHALLLHGPAGVGKRDLALALVQWLLCESPETGGACGRCDACNWFSQGNHPDFRLVEPQEADGEEGDKPARKGGRLISVEAVRTMTEFLTLSAHRGGWRAAVIHPAEHMNVAAANALLKTLEEPPPQVLLLLVSHKPGRLLPTVLSRCRQVAVNPPSRSVALDWLAQAGVAAPEALLAEAGGAPLSALAYADPERSGRRDAFLDALSEPARLDACVLAQAHKDDLADAWGWLARWLADLLATRLAGAPRYFQDRTKVAEQIGRQADLAGLLAFQAEITAAARWLRHPLNAQMLLESWLIRYIQVSKGRP
ncbi:MAG: DNA polymerase III subunit delta' [Pseudomonadota bacterium]